MGNLTTAGIASVALQSVLITPGLIFYIIVFIGLVITYKTSKNQFYILMISLAICDIIYLSETLFYSVPCIILQRSIYGPIVERLIGHVDTITWFLQCSHVLFISINRLRFVAGANLQTFDKVYTPLKILGWVFLMWIFSIGMSLMTEIASCHKYLDFVNFYWTFNCTENLSTNPVMIINSVVSGLFCLSSGLLYMITWLVVRFKKFRKTSTVSYQRRPTTEGKSRLSIEWSILIQFTAVTACLLANYLGFWIIPKILSATAATLLIQVFALANASVNPYIYLMFNAALREQILIIFHCVKITPKSPLTTSGDRQNVNDRVFNFGNENSTNISTL